MPSHQSVQRTVYSSTLPLTQARYNRETILEGLQLNQLPKRHSRLKY